jgi:phage minor structural protein
MFLKFSRDEIKIGTLKDIVSAKHIEEINGVDALEIETLDIDVEKGYRIVYKDRYGNFKEFIVTEIEEQNFGGGIIKRLYCESSLYETLGDYIEDKRPQNVTANIALANALLTTRWEVGTVDDLGLNSTNFYHISAKEAIQKVAEVFKGEIRTRIIVSGKEITHRYVDLLERRGGDYGKRFTYTKNLESVTKTVHSDDVVTALYGYGKGEEVGDGYGRRLDFADINDGKAYVEDLTALEIWGRNNTGGTKSHVFGKVEFDDVEDKTELLNLTTEKLSKLSEPKITYEANVIDLGGADLGDDVAVIDKEFTPELRLKARVIKVRRDLLDTQNDEITLGNFMPSVVDSLNSHDSYISNFRDKQGVWDRSNTINPDGTINAQFLNNLVDELNTRMNSQGGYVFISDDGKGLTTYDAPSPETATMAIQLLGGAFRIANSKLPDGSFDWTTFGDGNGFLADVFIGGLLKGGKVEFDLTNGTLLIGNNVEDYWLWFDGSRLRINGEVSSSSVIVGNETLEQTLINLGSQIEMIQGGGGNLLFNSNFGTFESPSDYWWSANGLTWLLYENRIATWTQHNALIGTWTDFQNYDW